MTILTTINTKVLAAGWSPLTDRFHSIEVLENILKDFTPSYGDLYYNNERTEVTCNLVRVSHHAVRMYIENFSLYAVLNVLDTPKGREYVMNKKNFKFHLASTGVINQFSEVEPSTVKFLKIYCRQTEKINARPKQ